jgi:hypothetical protein
MPQLLGFNEEAEANRSLADHYMHAAMDALDDPRNAWLSATPLGMVGKASKLSGWGAEVLRRYKLLGGTTETLNKALVSRAVDPSVKNYVISGYRKATDIAAPSQGPLSTMTTAEQQGHELENAGRMFEIGGNGLVGTRFGDSRKLAYRTVHEGIMAKYPSERIESGSQGNAAYSAVSRQVGRMLDQPEFLGFKEHYGPAKFE